MPLFSKREQKIEKLKDLSREIPKDISLPEREFGVILEKMFLGHPVVHKLAVKEESWSDRRLGAFQYKSILYCNTLPKCNYCGKEIKEDELVYFLEPSLKICCLNCTRPGTVVPIPLPTDNNFLLATPAFIKLRR